MNNLERRPQSYRNKIVKGLGRIFAITAIAAGSASDSSAVNSNPEISTDHTPAITDSLIESSPAMEQEGSYRKLKIVKASDEILSESGDVFRFSLDPTKISNIVDDEARENGYLEFWSGQNQNKVLLPTAIPDGLQKEIETAIAPLKAQVEQSGKKVNVVLFVYPHSKNVRLNGTAYINNSTNVGVVEIFANPDEQISSAEIKETVINEVSHLLYRSALTSLKDSEKLGEFWAEFIQDADNELLAKANDPESILYEQDIQKLLNHMPHQHQQQLRSAAENALWRVFMEKSYIGDGGHPWDGSEEFFTSALTVMYSTPKSFVATTSNLAPSDRQLVIKFAKFVIENVGEKVFDTTLLEYISKQNA